MLCHLNLIPSFCFVLSNHYMPLYMLLCGPKIRNKYLVSWHISRAWFVKRKCRICKTGEIGNEYHYLFTCYFFKYDRKRHIAPCFYKDPNILKFAELMNIEDISTVQVKKNPHFLFFSMINCLFFREKLGEIVENFSRFLQEIQYFSRKYLYFSLKF